MMAQPAGNRKKREKSSKNIYVFTILFLFIAGIPLLILNYQARKSGLSIKQVVQRKAFKTDQPYFQTGEEIASSNPGRYLEFLLPMPIGQAFTEPPQISNLAVSDLDSDGLMDIIVCDTKNNFVSWIQQKPEGSFSEHILATDLIAPAHVQIVDFDHDGDLDIMVAVLGMLFPSNDKIGSVVILENKGDCTFTTHTIAEKIARVSDVRAADLDGDGDNDLAVAQFGYDDGETRWMENLGGWKFRSHILQSLSGPVNIEITDIDKDGDNDIISLVSQEWEEIYCFLNDGSGNFRPNLLWGSTNEDFGSSGIYMFDIDNDGDDDILYTNGDAFDYIPPQGRPWHGTQWLENTGGLKFTMHRICNFVGAYSLRPADIDNDGDYDLFAVSAFNLWDNPSSQSFIWLENNGEMKFTLHNITNTPTHILTMEPGDFNNDGFTDFVTGGMHAYPPYDRMGRVTLWMNTGALAQSDK
jgi:hypothetical protein